MILLEDRRSPKVHVARYVLAQGGACGYIKSVSLCIACVCMLWQ